jgi:N-acetylglutamate synthase-like GNAT family acetyltransferase
MTTTPRRPAPRLASTRARSTSPVKEAEVRIALPGDHTVVAELFARHYPRLRRAHPLLYDPEAYARDLPRENFSVAARVIGDMLAGALVVRTEPRNLAVELFALVVRPEFRGSRWGVMESLVRSEVKRAQDAGMEYVYAWATTRNPFVQKFLASQGFRSSGTLVGREIVELRDGAVERETYVHFERLIGTPRVQSHPIIVGGLQA